MVKNKGQTEVEIVETDDQIKAVKAHLGIDNLDSLKSNFVLFVEGISEVEAFRKIGELTRYSSLKFIPIIPYEGVNNFSNLMNLIKRARDLTLVPLVIADGDDEVREVIQKYERGRRLRNKVRDGKDQLEEQFDSNTIVKAVINLYDCNMTASLCC